MSRHTRAIKIKHDRVITQYVKAKHPELYREAEQIYQMLEEKYPLKRDLTKTSEFLTHTTEYSTFQDLYRDRYKKKKANLKEATVSVTQEMRLEIPLMTTHDTNKRPSRQEDDDKQLCVPQDTYNILLEELRKDSELHKIFEDIMDNTPPPQSDVDEIIHQLGSSQPDQTCAKSPSLSRQLDDLMGEIDDMLPDLEEQSPLEMTLNN